jgi:hypothetical protein
VDSGASRNMTYDRKLFSGLQEQERELRVELGDDVTCHVKGMGSISFWMSSGDVLELNDALLVPSLKKKISLLYDRFFSIELHLKDNNARLVFVV